MKRFVILVMMLSLTACSTICDNTQPVGLIQNDGNSDVIQTTVFPEFEIVSCSRAAHDCTFIGEHLVSFDQPSDGGAVHYIDVSAMTVDKSIIVSFSETHTEKYLQWKSADYKFDKLLVGNGRAIASDESSYLDQGAYLYVFYDAVDWYDCTTQITADNCGDFDKIDVSDLGYKIYGFWGGYEDCVFVSCNLFNDIFLIQLGRGGDRLPEGKYAEAETGRYNGSYMILNHWSQDGNLGSWAAHGGQYYKGYLYLATNNLEECRVYKCALGNDGTLSFDCLNFEITGKDGIFPYYKYIDGLCIRDGKLYAQPLLVGTSTATDRSTFIVAQIE